MGQAIYSSVGRGELLFNDNYYSPLAAIKIPHLK